MLFLTPAKDLLHLLEPGSGTLWDGGVLSCLQLPVILQPHHQSTFQLGLRDPLNRPREPPPEGGPAACTAQPYSAGYFTPLALLMTLPQLRQPFQQDFRAHPASQQSWASTNVLSSL